MLNLKEKALSLNSQGGFPFMEGRTHGQLPTLSTVHVEEFDFMKGEDGDYAVLTLKEFPSQFFFGGSVVTNKLEELSKLLEEGEKELIAEEGLPVRFETRKTKDKKKSYTTCTFYPVEA